jgi:hypothetical protein
MEKKDCTNEGCKGEKFEIDGHKFEKCQHCAFLDLIE